MPEKVVRLDAGTPPHATHTPTALQGWVLVATAWLSVLASTLIGPILPTMTAAFRSTPSVDLKISLVSTLPALFVALLATPFGLLADRFGRRRVLLWSLGLYGVVGTAPLWLQSLNGIVGSRVLVGIAEAAVMTCGTALIGDYFNGSARERWLAMQTGTSPFVSTAMLALGGVLGETSWRSPFAVYAFGFILVPLVLLLIREPDRAHQSTSSTSTATTEFPWRRLLWINLVTVFALSAFLVTIIQSSFLLTERGVTSPGTIGLWTAVASLANPLGALLFILVPWGTSARLLFSFACMAAGFAVISLSSGPHAVVVGAGIANLGAGFVLPTLITWALSDLPSAQRGRGTGLWMSASFLGQFLSPQVILLLRNLTGSLDHAVLTYSVMCAAAALLSLFGFSSPAKRVMP